MTSITVTPLGAAMSVVAVNAFGLDAVSTVDSSNTAVNTVAIEHTAVALVPGVKGDKGDKGDKGNKGDKGDDGTHGTPGDTTFNWSPPTAQSIWVIPHNMHRRPSVTLTDNSGMAVGGKVNYADDDTIIVEFTAPFTGVAYLN
jgi:hypothetical protein